jgi:hypothetical protein
LDVAQRTNAGDALGANGIGELSRFFQRPAMPDPGNKAGGKCIASSGRIDDLDLKGRRPELLAIRGHHQAAAGAHLNGHSGHAQIQQGLGGTGRVVNAGQGSCFHQAGYEIVQVGQAGAKYVQPTAGLIPSCVQEGDDPGRPGPGAGYRPSAAHQSPA